MVTIVVHQNGVQENQSYVSIIVEGKEFLENCAEMWQNACCYHTNAHWCDICSQFKLSTKTEIHFGSLSKTVSSA